MNEPLVRKCSGCFLDYPKYKCCEDTYYCSKDCQSKQWNLHKNYCKAKGALNLKNVDAKVLNITAFLSSNMPKLCEILSEHYKKDDTLYIFHISFDVIENKMDIKDKENRKENEENENKKGKEEEEEEEEEGKKDKEKEKENEKEKKGETPSIFSEFGNWRHLKIQKLEKKENEKDHSFITSLFKDKTEAKFKVIIMFDLTYKNGTRQKYLYIYDPRIVKTTYFLNVTHKEFYRKISILNSSFWSSKVVFDSYITKTALEHFHDLNRV